MNLFSEALAWIFSPERASGALPLGQAIATHLGFSFAALLIAALIAIPTGWFIGHTGLGRDLVIALTGASRAIPSFGLLLLLVVLLGVTHKEAATVTALVLLALAPILAGAYSGIEGVPAATRDAASAIGMSQWQVLFRVEVPLSLPILLGAIRSALLQVVATVTIAGYISNWGLGFYIIQGIQLRDYAQILGASLLIVVLALALDFIFAGLNKGLSRFFDPLGASTST
ncbi:ABC transporter permease [Corynebacterium flavescens]|uniref:ABC transporter permease n=1 Tax=Corynebacterium flavescens TaxID=28028 RepID=UPI000EC5A84E|nr:MULTISPECIES: ABC transporter permease subunit [Corynebacterium]MDN6198555.1 ABC transporter permease subunit [Corynebacterium flavescens]MDN6227476.1 ABC transporter permease subunit [Corynebacterium flavescens]HCG46612.1 glycine/betaine ABC transporter permease [Corynebacterium flavescens]